MRKHTKIYLNTFYPDFTNEQFFPCEICGGKAVDIHHIESRGMGGGSKKDEPDNLMALCRSDHMKYGDKTQYKDYLKKIHGNFQKTVSWQ